MENLDIKLTFKDFDVSLDKTQSRFSLVLTRSSRHDADL